MSGKTFYVKADDDGIRLDRWFKRNQPEVPHALLSRWLRQGLIRLNGERATTGDRIVKGQRIDVPPIEAATPPEVFAGATATAAPRRRPGERRAELSAEDTAFAQSMVIHRDGAALVLNKPPGIATQGGTKVQRHVDGLLDALCFEREDRPRLVHRLDKDTSGVLLLARSANAAGYFSKAFSSRNARKVYWALVVGVPKAKEGLIKAPLAKQAGTGGEKMAVDEANGQPAATRYRIIERAGQSAAWLELQPLTGRTHQLRVHCAEILGCPIVGDGKYGGQEAFLTGNVSRKLHLHARSLSISHPDGTLLSAAADMPAHMQASWSMLGFDLGTIEALEPIGAAFDPMAEDELETRGSSARGTGAIKRKLRRKTPEEAPREPGYRRLSASSSKVRKGERRRRQGQGQGKPGPDAGNPAKRTSGPKPGPKAGPKTGAGPGPKARPGRPRGGTSG